MAKKVRRVIKPSYYDAFHCVADRCEDNCCIGWDVEIDRRTYEKYTQVEHEELTPLFRKYVHPQVECYDSEVDFAYVELLKRNRCPFLNDRRLCKIQAALGEEFLSNVCATYPRSANVVNGVTEYSMTLSCPQAARLILAEERGISFKVGEESSHVRRIVNCQVDTNHCHGAMMVKYLHELREFTIKALQNRNRSLPFRLWSVAPFFRSLSHHLKDDESDQDSAVKQLLKRYRDIVFASHIKANDQFYDANVDAAANDNSNSNANVNANANANGKGNNGHDNKGYGNYGNKNYGNNGHGDEKGSVNALGADRERKATGIKQSYLILRQLTESTDHMTTVDMKRYTDLIRRAEQGIASTAKLISQNEAEAFQYAYANFYLPFEAKYGFILENYLVNYVFQELFPAGESTKPLESYAALVLRYTLIRYYLTGLAAETQNLEADLAISFIQAFSKAVEHHHTYLECMSNLMRERGFLRPEAMAAFIGIEA